eukprot:6820273-Prymnesium_polylepis.1
MRFKVKALVGFYQCIAAVPSVFDVMPPEGLEEYTRWMSLLEVPASLEDIIMPSACFGDYHEQVWYYGSMWPIVFLLEVSRAAVPRHFDPRRIAACPTTHAWADLCATAEHIHANLQGIEAIEYSSAEVRRYLRADLATMCHSHSYEKLRTTGTAFAFIAIWPVGTTPALEVNIQKE